MTHNGLDLTADSSKRARRSVRFELNLFDAEERFIYETVLKWWKAQRKMVTNMRQAILLFYDLSQGKTERLTLYFPHVVAALTGQAVQEHADTIVERVADAVEDRVAGMSQQIVTLPEGNRQSIAKQTEIAALAIELEVTGGGKASAEEVAKNFFGSMGGLFS